MLCYVCRGAETEVKDVYSCTPFLLAAASGYREVVRELKEKTQIDSLDINRKSAIYLAAEGAHLPLLVVRFDSLFPLVLA